MMRKESLITSAMLILIVYTLSLSALSSAFPAGQTSKTFSSSGSIQIQSSPGIGIYQDQNGIIPFTSISWGTLQPGGSQQVTLYIKNEGSTATVLGLETSNWNSASAQTYLTLDWNYDETPISPNDIIQVTLTLAVSSSITGVTTFSFDITITASA